MCKKYYKPTNNNKIIVYNFSLLKTMCQLENISTIYSCYHSAAILFVLHSFLQSCENKNKLKIITLCFVPIGLYSFDDDIVVFC